MARSVCDQCGERLAARANACPGCGSKRRPYLRRLHGTLTLWLLAAAIALAAYVVLVGTFFARAAAVVQ